MTQSSRRNFLKTSTVGAIAVASAPGAIGISANAQTNPSNSRIERSKSLGRLPVGNEINGNKYEGSEFKNKRSVWTITTKPYKGAHFATFPRELVEPCILAGSKEGDIVFDPFMGSGTTAQVAKELGRQYMGCELNYEYKKLQDERLNILI
jgi:DNA modification methylase